MLEKIGTQWDVDWCLALGAPYNHWDLRVPYGTLKTPEHYTVSRASRNTLEPERQASDQKTTDFTMMRAAIVCLRGSRSLRPRNFDLEAEDILDSHASVVSHEAMIR